MLRCEAERSSLLVPINGERCLEIGKPQRWRLGPVEDGLDNVGRQEGQPDRSRQVGAIDALLLGSLRKAGIGARIAGFYA